MLESNLYFTMLQARKWKQATFISRMIYSIKIFIVNTICIPGNMGNFQIRRTFFCGIYRCWLQPMVMKLFENYTIYSFLKGWAKSWYKILNVLRWEGVTKIEQVRTRNLGRSKFRSFYDKVISECYGKVFPSRLQ